MATVRAFLKRLTDVLLGPLEPVADDNDALLDLQKDLASSVAWSFQALLAASAFCAVTAASHADWDLLKGGEAELPLISLKLAFYPFLLIGPLALLAMQIYLQLQTHALLLMPRANENSLIRNHDQWWPLSLLGFASYAAVPLVTVFLLWKVWPRSFSDDPVLFGAIHFHIGRLAVGAALAVSCLASLRAAVSDRRCLSQLREHTARRRFGLRAASITCVALLALSAWVGSAFVNRHMELRKAPLDGADLRYFDLTAADLREARLRGALMGGAMLPDANLAGANLDNADLRGVQLTGADLSESRLNNADLTGAWLVGANLRRVEVEGAKFDYAWMVGSTFEPLPATLADRSQPPKPHDLDYAKAGWIETATFNGAQMCGAIITPGHWKDRTVQVGQPDLKGGSPFFDKATAGQIPEGFHATPLPTAAAPDADDRDRFMADALDHCFINLGICALDPYPAQCDWKSGE